MITRDVLNDVMTTQWTKRKLQIKEDYQKTLASENAQTQKMAKQLELVEGQEGPGPLEFDSLINLSMIAEKAKEEIIRREEKLRRSQERVSPKPFIIHDVYKEDLNIVLVRDIAGQSKLVDGDTRHSFLASQPLPSSVLQPAGRIPHKTMTNFTIQQKQIQRNFKPHFGLLQVQQNKEQDKANQKIREVLMYKQLVAMAKNKEEEDSEDDGKDNENKKPARAPTPELIDSSESEMEDHQEQQRTALTPVGGRKADKNESIETDRRASQLLEGSLEDPALTAQQEAQGNVDSEFVKYVWNKKTKRLEQRDIRHTANLDVSEMRKFELFSKVNEKSKILCMQLEDNYLNTTIIPQAIAGACEVNFKEIQEEQIYAPNDLKMRQGFLQKTSPIIALKDSDYQQLPVYKKHMVAAQALLEGKPNMLNKKRRTSIEAKNRVYEVKQGDSILSSAKAAQEKLFLPSAITDQEVVNQKLAVIRNALRGGSLVTATGDAARQNYDDYLQGRGSSGDHQNAVSAAAVYNKNAAFFNQAVSTMGVTATTQFQQQRAQSLLETRELFMRSKIHAVQQTNKKAILSQRQNLKSSMYQTQMSQFAAFDMLPQLEASQARIFQQQNAQKQVPYGKHTSPGLQQVRHHKQVKEVKTPNLLQGASNVSVRLQIQNAASTYQKPGKTRTSMMQRQEGSSGQPNSPRSSNNNMDIIEYGVLPFKQEVKRDMVVRDSLMVHTGEGQVPKGYSSLIKTAPHGKNVFSDEQAAKLLQQAMGMTQGESRFRKGPFASSNEEQDSNDLLSMSQMPHLARKTQIKPYPNREQAFSALGAPNSTKYSMAPTSLIQDNRAKKTFINQLPMQDFHLEQWRTAYKNINSATRHFYTGSSYPALVKL